MLPTTTLFMAALAAALGYLYYPVFADLARQWSIDTTYGYGYFIPVVAVYLLWDRRYLLRAATVGSSWWGYPVLLIGLVSLLVGRAGGIELLARLSLIPVLFGLVLFLGGWRVTTILAFPLAFLMLMVPPPSSLLTRLTWPLQIFTAWFSTEFLRRAGYPVLLNGIYIDLPDIRLLVSEACSGFRGLITLGATGLLLAYMTQHRWPDRALLLAAVVPIAILSNAIRVTVIILLGIYSDPWHSLSGWIIFVLETALLISLAVVLNRRQRSPAGTTIGVPA